MLNLSYGVRSLEVSLQCGRAAANLLTLCKGNQWMWRTSIKTYLLCDLCYSEGISTEGCGRLRPVILLVHCAWTRFLWYVAIEISEYSLNYIRKEVQVSVYLSASLSFVVYSHKWISRLCRRQYQLMIPFFQDWNLIFSNFNDFSLIIHDFVCAYCGLFILD